MWIQPGSIKNSSEANLGMCGPQKRFRTLLEQLSMGVGESIPLVCQDWANTKAVRPVFVQRGRQRSRHSGLKRAYGKISPRF
jgi:hypothetical protein